MSDFEFHDKKLSLTECHVMGVLNVTPDSFSDGGRFATIDQALRRALQMEQAGAAIVDIGGESTRPGAALVSVSEELDRVIPVVEALRKEADILVSLDTSTPEVMIEGAKVGAHMINDVRALQREGAIEAAAQSGLPICLMHMQGEPSNMQQNPSYHAVLAEVGAFLSSRVELCIAAGIAKHKILIDPGFGFGKTLEHNLSLLKHLDQLEPLGFPKLVGMSRKSMIGTILDKSVDQRLFGSLASAVIAAQKGAWMIRVHDVAETMDVIKIVNAVRAAE